MDRLLHLHLDTLCQLPRQHLSAALLAGAISVQVMESSLRSPLIGVSWALIVLGVLVYLGNDGNDQPRSQGTHWGLWCIMLAGVAAVPASLVFHHTFPQTVILLLLTIPMLGFFYACDAAHLPRIMGWLTPTLYLHAGVMAYQVLFTGLSRVPGIGVNQNAGAGFLLIGVVFLATTRYRWLSLPLLLVLPFAGSRWVTVVGVTVLALMFLSHYIPWRYLLAGIVVGLAIICLTMTSSLSAAYRLNTADNLKELEARQTQDIAYRLSAPWDTWYLYIIPQGFLDSQLHNVPLRLLTELGALGALPWIGITGLMLVQRPRFDPAWWMLLTTALLSIMYYHTWVGAIGPFWWLALGSRSISVMSVHHSPVLTRRFPYLAVWPGVKARLTPPEVR